ncbi:hypothetical protein, partial [Streptococcus caprae]
FVNLLPFLAMRKEPPYKNSIVLFILSIIRGSFQITVTFEVAASLLFLTQDFFEDLSVTKLKARISENSGKMEVIFDVRNQKDYQILEELIAFGEKLQEIKARKDA